MKRKNHLRSLCAGVLSVALLLGNVAAAEVKAPPAWAAEAYDHLEEAGVGDYRNMKGDKVDRYWVIWMLVGAVQAAVPEEKWKDIEPVPWDYFADGGNEVLWTGAAYGITEGRIGEDGKRYLDHGNKITRQECAKMVCATLDFVTGLGYEIAPSGKAAVYTDQDTIASWAAPFTGRMASYGLMVGDTSGNFLPTQELDWPSAVVLVSRTLKLMDRNVSEIEAENEKREEAARPGLRLDTQMDWSGALDVQDHAVSRPHTGYAPGHYTAVDKNGVITGVVVPQDRFAYNYTTQKFENQYPTEFYVERYDESGAVTFSKTLPMELPLFDGFLAAEDGSYYLAFGQENPNKDDSLEVWRIVKYDHDWNRVGSVSATGGETYTTEPYRATVSRMAESADGREVILYAARTRYDGHQSNITFRMSAEPFRMTQVMGEKFPSNHVSHSFGQFVQFDGGEFVTVDHGDAYPRSFVLQNLDGTKEATLLKIAGSTGDNVTNAIGSGFEVSDDGYLFLGCSDPQRGGTEEPWNVFLTYTDKSMNSTTLTWLTHSGTTIDCARLVKLSGNSFLAMWKGADGVHYQKLNAQGGLVGSEGVLENVPMPTTQPVVDGGAVRWIGVTSDKEVRVRLYTLTVD